VARLTVNTISNMAHRTKQSHQQNTAIEYPNIFNFTVRPQHLDDPLGVPTSESQTKVTVR